RSAHAPRSCSKRIKLCCASRKSSSPTRKASASSPRGIAGGNRYSDRRSAAGQNLTFPDGDSRGWLSFALGTSRAWRARMKKQRRTVLHALFPHHDDAAYQKLAEIEELVADFRARRGTAPFRQRLQRAIARLSESL